MAGEIVKAAKQPESNEPKAAVDAGPNPVDRVVMEVSAPGGAEVPNRVLIAPWGEVQSSMGSFIVDEAAAAAAIAAFEEHGTELPVDYEHQTLGGPYSSPSGEAPAAGWVKALSAVAPGGDVEDEAQPEPGLWGEVSWTSAALEKLRARKYRYLSPVALVRRSDRRLVGIHSVALTNKPAIVGMRPVVNREPAAVSSIGARPSPAAVLRNLLSLDDSTSGEVVLVAAADRIQAMENSEKSRAATARVSHAMSAGKLTEAQREWALTLAQRDPETFDAWEATAPVVVSLGRLAPPSVAGSNRSEQKRAIEVSARAEWHANRGFLDNLCTESAFVADALREYAA